MSKPKKCQAKESLERMNYLYQIANELMASNSTNSALSKSFSNLMIQVSKKTVQRIDVDIKRRICKGCKSILLPGVNCKVRIKKKIVKWSCCTCQNLKVFPSRNENPVWSQNEESIVEVLNYENN